MDAQTGKTASGTRHVHSNQEGELQPTSALVHYTHADDLPSGFMGVVV